MSWSLLLCESKKDSYENMVFRRKFANFDLVFGFEFTLIEKSLIFSGIKFNQIL